MYYFSMKIPYYFSSNQFFVFILPDNKPYRIFSHGLTSHHINPQALCILFIFNTTHGSTSLVLSQVTLHRTNKMQTSSNKCPHYVHLAEKTNAC